MDKYVVIQTVAVVAQTIIYTLTLIFLIRQNVRLQKTMYASNYTRLIEILKELRMLRIEQPDLSHVYEDEVKGLSDLDIKYHFFNLIVLSALEILYMNRKQGLITEDTWEFWLQSIRNLCHEKSFRDMIQRKSYKIVNPDFCKLVEGMVAEVEKELATAHEPMAPKVATQE